MNIWDDYEKVLSVINSCQTTEQLKSAAKFLGLWYDKHLDYRIYQNTYVSYLETKFFELGGVDTSVLIYKKDKDNEIYT